MFANSAIFSKSYATKSQLTELFPVNNKTTESETRK